MITILQIAGPETVLIRQQDVCGAYAQVLEVAVENIYASHILQRSIQPEIRDIAS